ncbi:alpha-ketoglutarate-dependent dioxygenase AlkB [Pseudoxanthomonas sp. CAU 1598]|uniref:Alpha-ketoglutarate-dependent dioxygenase AlkB n=2 Tax=Pseudomarimonas arenosa TaxID=2774145 RepID=A0AAW3ZJP9_9GAMM|nr:alpha-ketoglutarate-dependent dioxygenase AlkB [Pseudomarimonas arenosa]MBD8525444.1 alpha-ketoglutarate-dependent dioxygenase AlkB [Pseudomarimonas arenosa]
MRQFIAADRAESLLAQLTADTPWRADTLTLFGKQHAQPRLTAWYGDPGCNYSYSGLAMRPLLWTGLLQRLRAEVEHACRQQFNSVLLNYYRNQRDSMGMHSDDEPELGPAPVIASLSLGEQRTLKFAPRNNPQLRAIGLPLPSGSLLLMQGDTQRNWKHGIAKSTRPMGPRISLTFRWIGKPGKI